ncbi:hypothetical protein C8A00DRAFT_40948 [Chaetomidium leptoderma]|uniref:HORMA domain-containing protein n=1 Tax=Chaetomidium leptoderma TaxID=669021 RepID=A0AAN7A178_9PEZI|nr:hypothetical protein C8A00DRAFT_40948 [Chaetomidium leptoderma]
MPTRLPVSYTTPERQPNRDFELCKVVFGAAISQILYARRAFPPECFQLLPLEVVVSKSFEDIVASGSDIQVHDKEQLRDQGTTLFLRQGKGYGVNRFLGILRDDIFPLIENEALVKFRVNYLRTRTWGDNCLAESYTVALKYEQDGSYGLDIWRGGTGTQHIATSDAQLWNLGDYLTVNMVLTETGSMHWTLAFHATERPDDPPIGVWRFDRTDFDDANLDLQQRAGYTYDRVVRLEIVPLTPTDVDEVISETSPEPEHEVAVYEKTQSKLPGTGTLSQTRRTRAKPQAQDLRNGRKSSGSRRRVATAVQLSPPLTLASSRNTSKSTTEDKQNKTGVAVNNKPNGLSRSAEGTRNSSARKGLVTRRKPKRPLQLFEDVTSSLPPTQIIGDSQSLGKTLVGKSGRNHELSNELVEQTRFGSDVPRSSSFDPFKLLDGISLSPEAISATRSSPYVDLPQLPRQLPSTQGPRLQGTPVDEFRGLLRFAPSSIVSGAPRGLSQWEPRASPPANLLGMAISDDEENIETASEAEPATLPRLPTAEDGELGITYDFSPNTVARRTSLFYDIPCSSVGEE